MVASELPAVDGVTVGASVPRPTVISPAMVVSATFDFEQLVVMSVTAARTRSTGSTRRARMPKSPTVSRGGRSAGGLSAPRAFEGRIRAGHDLDAQPLASYRRTELPLVERPYAALAEAIGSDEATVLERVAALREQKVIREISAIFDSRRLGYSGMLVAARTPEERQDDAAAVFSSHPGASHNYLPEHQ